MIKRLDHLKGPGDSEIHYFVWGFACNIRSPENNVSGYGFYKSGNEIDKGCFPGPVRADDAQELSLFEVEADPGNRHDSPEGFREVRYFEQG